jgi:hypothetical protein
MTQVRWYGVQTFVEIEEGAHFTWDPVAVGAPLEHVIEGFLLQISYNGVGPVTPFDQDITVIATGNNVRFANQNPLAKPMFKTTPGGFAILIFSGEQANGGLQNYPAGDLAAPIIDVNGGGFFILGGAGIIANGFATDLSVGGGGFLVGDTFSDFYGDFYEQWAAPALFANGGLMFMDANRPPVRYRVNPQFAGVPVVMSPYAAAYNEFVPVDTTLGAVVIEMPKAGGAVFPDNFSVGERVTIKDVGGNALAANITFVSTYGDTIEPGSDIVTNGGSREFVCWGTGVWSRV